jgi:hypothetical protein
MGAYSKRLDLADELVSAVRHLRQAQEQTNEPAHGVQSTPLSTRQWRVGDCLSETDTEWLASFNAGTSKRKLAERYGISESSVKRLIRQYGAPKPLRGLPERQWLHLPRREDGFSGQHRGLDSRSAGDGGAVGTVLSSTIHRERAPGRTWSVWLRQDRERAPAKCRPPRLPRQSG